MAETAGEVKAPEFTCKDCEDTGKVRITLTGASGDIKREVPCPGCENGITISPHLVDVEDIRAEFGGKLQLLAMCVAVAIAVAALALLAKGGTGKVIPGLVADLKEAGE